ncbi:MAG TPA: anhydro-N-acetylmuramic acid kinase [Kiloniellales bacterium]|nr:anhydro-N-acetylmuramic acid kinase [Kiloniellales bacterium]
MTHDSALWAVGLMSGTSLDGIDIALIRTDGERVLESGPSETYPYDEAFRQRLRRHLGGKGSAASIAATEAELTERHARAVDRLLHDARIPRSHVGIVGFHGQTILHAPAEHRTWQIGDGALLAQRLGLPVVNDFRSADVAAGGQGAPFVPVYHRALAHDLGRPLGVLNLGGVANVTWIGRGAADLIACDTGPANALLDDWVAARTNLSHDEDGSLSAAGHVDRAVLEGLLSHPYFALPPPKSLDRDAFDVSSLAGLGLEDGAATLAAFTVGAVARVLPHLPEAPRRWLVGGGGRHNPTIMRGLEEALRVPVEGVDAVGWNGDALEAQAFAFLAVRSALGLPLSFPGTTGVPRPLTGGRLNLP